MDEQTLNAVGKSFSNRLHRTIAGGTISSAEHLALLAWFRCGAYFFCYVLRHPPAADREDGSLRTAFLVCLAIGNLLIGSADVFSWITSRVLSRLFSSSRST